MAINEKWITIIKMYSGRDELPQLDNMKIEEYASWYAGKVDSFHTYRIYNGDRSIELEKKSLQMPKKVCEDWADILANEKLEIRLANDKDNKVISQILKDNKFHPLLSNAVEKSFALSFGIITASVINLEVGENTKLLRATPDTRIKLKYISADKVVPITIEDNELKECAFVYSNTRETTIVIYVLDEKNEYKIINLLFDNKTPDIPKVSYEFNTGYKDVPFATIRPNINVNTFGLDMVGMSIYGNSIDTFKVIDDIFDSMGDEFPLARRRLFISTEAYDEVARINNNGDVEFTKTFDVTSSLFYRLVNNDPSSNTPIQDVASPIRDQAYSNGLNLALNILSKQVGFGTQRYKFDPVTYQTATSVISANQDLAQSMTKHATLLKEELTSLIMFIKYLNNNFTLNEKFSDFKNTDVLINFDDSVIEDNASKMERDKADVTANIMSIPEYRAKWYGETIEEATEVYRKEFQYDLINKYLPALQSGAITPTDFAKKVYGENVEQEVIDYIAEEMRKTNQSIVDAFGEE